MRFPNFRTAGLFSSDDRIQNGAGLSVAANRSGVERSRSDARHGPLILSGWRSVQIREELKCYLSLFRGDGLVLRHRILRQSTAQFIVVIFIAGLRRSAHDLA